MSLILDGSNGITFPSGSVQNNAVANTAAITAILGSRGLPASVVPAGSVLQVVTTTKTNTTTSSSGSYIDVGLSAAITPSSATSKIFIIVSLAMGSDTGSANVGFRIQNITAGTSVSNDPYYVARWPSDGQSAYYCQKINHTQIDSPATTSATTYSIQMKTNGGSFQVNMPANNGGFSSTLISTITLMEIAQ